MNAVQLDMLEDDPDLLRGEIAALHVRIGDLEDEVEPARNYVYPGPECYDGECEDYFVDDEPVDPAPTVCSHAVRHTATRSDVLARERLEDLLADVRDRLRAIDTLAGRAAVTGVIRDIDQGVKSIVEELNDDDWPRPAVYVMGLRHRLYPKDETTIETKAAA